MAKAKTKCGLMCCALTPETVERIRLSVAEGRGKSSIPDEPNRLFGAQCRCGVPRKPSGLARHVADDGLCVVHPEKPPQAWTRGAGK